MRSRAGTLILLLVCAGGPCLAQATGAVLPASGSAVPGQSFGVEVRVDVTATGQELGSYGAVLTWDPAVLLYSGMTAGPFPFDTPVVNDTSVATGILGLADADPVGAPGDVLLVEISFLVVGFPCEASTISLSMTSLHAAVSLDDLLPLAAIQNALVSVEDHDYGLEVFDPASTVLFWNPLPGADSYDVIRVEPAVVYQDPTTVHLGTVVCWEEDSLDATTAAGTEAANPDTDLPAPGQGFFYLVRSRFGGANLTYGLTGGCARERIPDATDCL